METLGVILAPDGNNGKMITNLRQKAQSWGELITSGHISKQHAFIALQTTICKSLQYPLPALTLKESECTYIMAPAITQGLSASGRSKTFLE